ncbi:MAG: hypothetical protein IJH12_08490 [Clostridia bacterium]|nr:hypothetical protein [Clostridia bacterium]
MTESIFYTTLFVSFAMVGVVYLIQYIMVSLGYMSCMKKAGEKAWKAWVPFYNDFTMYKIVGLKSFLIVFKILSAIITIIYLGLYVGLFFTMYNDLDDYIDSNSYYNYSTNKYTESNSTNRYQSNTTKRRTVEDIIDTSYADDAAILKDDSNIDLDEYMDKTIGMILVALLEMLFGIGVFVVNIFFAIKISKAYGLGGGYIAGMILVPQIFILIIGFGKSEYKGSYNPNLV